MKMTYKTPIVKDVRNRGKKDIVTFDSILPGQFFYFVHITNRKTYLAVKGGGNSLIYVSDIQGWDEAEKNSNVIENESEVFPVLVEVQVLRDLNFGECDIC